MSEKASPSPKIVWIDLTVPNADEVRDFYANMLGFRPEPVEMGDYSDYNMVNPTTDDPVLGICHKQGANTALPPQWIVYFTVPDLETSISKAVGLGATIIDGPRSGFCVIRDPGGAITALYQATEAEE